MKKMSIEEVYALLKRYKYVEFDDDVFKMKTQLNENGLIVTVKNKRESSVMLFPHENNTEIEVSDTTVSLYDGCRWRHDFSPLNNVTLI